MPVHVEEMTSEVMITDPDFPLTPEQIDKLVSLVMTRIAEKNMRSKQMMDEVKVRPQIINRFEE